MHSQPRPKGSSNCFASHTRAPHCPCAQPYTTSGYSQQRNSATKCHGVQLSAQSAILHCTQPAWMTHACTCCQKPPASREISLPRGVRPANANPCIMQPACTACLLVHTKSGPCLWPCFQTPLSLPFPVPVPVPVISPQDNNVPFALAATVQQCSSIPPFRVIAMCALPWSITTTCLALVLDLYNMSLPHVLPGCTSQCAAQHAPMRCSSAC